MTVTLPDAGKRFMSMQVIDEDHYTPAVVYGAGSHTFTREKIGTRYVSLGVRTLVDPADPEDVEAGPRAAGRDQGRAAGRSRALRGARTGTRRARRRCATRCWCLAATLPDYEAHVRQPGARSIRCGT